MRYVELMSRDSRNSEEKTRIIRETEGKRTSSMLSSPDFLSYGEAYWDVVHEDSKIGYGGYVYDGRYRATAEKIVRHYALKPGDIVLEVGCGKGYFLVEFQKLGMRVVGIEVSSYAYSHSHPDIREFIRHEDFISSRIPERSADLVIAKDTLPHMPKEQMPEVLQKIMSISRKHSFLEIEVCRNDYEREMLYQWDLTHVTRESPQWWQELLRTAKYQGDYHLKVLVEDPALGELDMWLKKNSCLDDSGGAT